MNTPVIDRPRIVCLCGSTRFYDQYVEENYQETMKGNIVLSAGCFGHTIHKGRFEMTDEHKRKMDELHKRKIDIADEVRIINVGGYIGESTKSEIEYARTNGKVITYLECP